MSEKEECEHEPIEENGRYVCKKCGMKGANIYRPPNAYWGG